MWWQWLAAGASLTVILAFVYRVTVWFVDDMIEDREEASRDVIAEDRAAELVPLFTKLEEMAVSNKEQLDSIQLRLTAMEGEMGRLSDIEARVKNGLTERQRRIEDKVDRIIEHYVWNGEERRGM